jgi:hypothetical protein
MAETLQNGIRRSAQMGAGAGPVLGAGPGGLVRAVEVADDVPVRRSANGVQFATFGETGLADLDLDRMLEAVPAAIVTALEGNTYYFVPLALRADEAATSAKAAATMVASAWSAELGDAAICHRNVELPHGRRGVFISTRLMGDRFALSFEFFINVAHAFVDRAGVPEGFAALVWQQAVSGVRGETSLDAWESRNMAFGRAPNVAAEDASGPRRRRNERGSGARAFMAAGDRESTQRSGQQAGAVVDEKERTVLGVGVLGCHGDLSAVAGTGL